MRILFAQCVRMYPFGSSTHMQVTRTFENRGEMRTVLCIVPTFEIQLPGRIKIDLLKGTFTRHIEVRRLRQPASSSNQGGLRHPASRLLVA